MGKETFFLTAQDEHSIVVQKWLPKGKPVAIICISHGMAEYASRYEYFAQKANEKGFAVYAHDHRGHGESAGNDENLGYLSDSKGFDKVVDDVKQVVEHARTEFPNTKTILFAHSFGSFVGQRFIQLYANIIDAVILSGSKGPDPLLVFPAKVVSNIIAVFKGKKHKSKLLTDLAFGANNKRIPDAKSKNAWLTRDEKEVELYDESPWCGFMCTVGFYTDLMYGLTLIHAKKSIAQVPVDLPILVTGGAEDPVNAYGRLQKKLFDVYKKRGVKDLSIKLYEDCRHEMMFELNKDDFLKDIFAWIESK